MSYSKNAKRRWKLTTPETLVLALTLGACSAEHGNPEREPPENESASRPQPGTQAYVEAVQALKLSAPNDVEYARGLARLHGEEIPLEVAVAGKELQGLNDPEGVLRTVEDVPLYQTFLRYVVPAEGEHLIVQADDILGYGDPMLAVIRWKVGAEGSRFQSTFDVLAFNDDSAGLGLGSKVSFTADGQSTYAIIAMPYSEDSDGAAQLSITGCATCNTVEQIPIVGNVQHSVKGNEFQAVAAPGERPDPWMFAFRLFPDIEQIGNGQYVGVGVSNDDGEMGNNNLLPKIRTDLHLTGNYMDLLLTRSYGSALPLKTVDVVWKKNSTSISGLSTRPQNSTCVAPVDANNIPPTLEQTGCFVKLGNELLEQYIPGVMSYEVAHGFWSDGVVKERALALPNNTAITVDANGKWQLPVGAVMIKSFRPKGGLLFETRFVAQTASGPLAYSYKWEDNPRRATRVDNVSPPATLSLGNNYTWVFPVSTDCTSCHNNASGNFFLGLKSSQFNVDAHYETGLVANQITTLKSVQMLTGPGVTANKFDHALPPRPDTLTGEAYSPEQGRAFLDTNCGYCHTDRKQSMAWSWNGEYALSAAGTELCDGTRLVPGDADGSLIYQRANTRNKTPPAPTAMPDRATTLVDHASMEVLSQWIDEMDGCGMTDVDLRLVTHNWGCVQGDLAGKRITFNSCDTNAPLQEFRLVDEGNGFVSVRAASSTTECVQYKASNNSVVLDSCGTTHWRRVRLPGGSFELRAQANNELCLTFDADSTFKPLKCAAATVNADTVAEQAFYTVDR